MSLAFFLPAVWLFRHLNFQNAGHPVIRSFSNAAGGKQLLAAMDFLNQIEELKLKNKTRNEPADFGCVRDAPPAIKIASK